MATCSEPLVWICSSCGHSFHEKEWISAFRKCPACTRTLGSWKCTLCQETFNQPALSTKHPCRRDSSAFFGEEGVWSKHQTHDKPAIFLNKRTLGIASAVALGFIVFFFLLAGLQRFSASQLISYKDQGPSPSSNKAPKSHDSSKAESQPYSSSSTEAKNRMASSPPVPATSPKYDEEAFRSNYVKAAEAFSRNDLDDSLRFLALAEEAKPSQANCANLKGAIYTRKRDWPKAQDAFEEALRLQPNLPMAEFNLGEVHFLNKEYAAARTRFKTFLQSQPQNDLAQYKVFLCDLFTGNESKTNQFLKNLQPSSASPIYYFCRAAQSFVKGNTAEAMDFINSAYRIYPAEDNATFADSLVEKGYLQSP